MTTTHEADTVATVMAAARPARQVIIAHDVAPNTLVKFEVIKGIFLQSFAGAGLRPGDVSGFHVLEANREYTILLATPAKEA